MAATGAELVGKSATHGGHLSCKVTKPVYYTQIPRVYEKGLSQLGSDYIAHA